MEKDNKKKIVTTLLGLVTVAVLVGTVVLLMTGMNKKASTPPTIEQAKEFVISKEYKIRELGPFDTTIEDVDELRAEKGMANGIRYMIAKEGKDTKAAEEYILSLTGKWDIDEDNYKEYEYKYEDKGYKLGVVKDNKYAMWIEIGEGGIKDKDAILKKFALKK